MSEQSDPTIERPSGAGRENDFENAEDATGLQHVTVEPDDEVAVCTMFPQHLEGDVSSQWLTATGDSFVPLADAR